MSRKCAHCKQPGHYIKNCPALPCSYCQSIEHDVGHDCAQRQEDRKKNSQPRLPVENLTLDRLDKKRERDRVESLTPDRLDKKRKGNRVESMTPDRVDKTRKGDRVESMTPDRVEAERERTRMTTGTNSPTTTIIDL